MKSKIKLSTYLKKLKKKGFENIFEFRDGAMKCLQNEKIYRPEDMILLSGKRFITENNAPVGVFLLVCRDGTKGVSTVTYNSVVNAKLINFLNKVKVRISSISNGSTY